MKLLNRTTLYYLIPAVILIIICGGIQYALVNDRIIKRVDKQLVKEKKLIIKQLKDLENTDELRLYKTLKSEIEIKEDIASISSEDKYSSALSFDEEDQEEISVRILEFTSVIKNQTFVVSIKKPMEETQTFVFGLVGANILLFTSLLILVTFINRSISKKIWQPFYATLKNLEQFNISDPSNHQFPKSNTFEFELLNNELETLFQKITRDYNTYKYFIENVSHELQTPIAVIKSKLELVIQSPNIKEKEHGLLHKMGANLNKLTKLNQSLILLLKIENNLFVKQETIEINPLVQNALENFEDIIELRCIQLKVEIKENFTIQCNDLLAEVLVDNLIKNAVKHNIEKGFIHIFTDGNRLIFQNSGLPLTTSPELLFERFKKDSVASDSTGLGLSIVHQISKSSGFKIKYTNSEEVHQIELIF